MLLYRVVRSDPPGPGDFQSNMARCRPRIGAELTDPSLWPGLSTWTTFAAATLLATSVRGARLGAFVAELDVPDTDPRAYVQPTRRPGHVTLFACADLCAGWVQATMPVPGLTP
jgi:hypothetical protein